MCSKETTQSPENTAMQEMRPTCQLHLSSGRLALLNLCCALLPFQHTQRFYKLAAPWPRGGGGASWEQNVNSSAADKRGGRNPCCRASCPNLPTWFTSCSPLRRNRIHSNKGDLYLCQVNNVAASSWLLLMEGLRNKCACLQDAAAEWDCTEQEFKTSAADPEKWRK